MANKFRATLIENSIPSFIKAEYPNFVEFIKLYYSQQDEQGEAYEFIANILNYSDINLTTLEYLENFTKTYLNSMADALTPGIDKRNLIENIKQLYESAGSEKSIKFLFKLLFNEDVRLFYPTNDILRVSDGKWDRDFVIKISNNRGDEVIRGLEGTEILGQTSGARGLIEKITLYTASNGFLVAECSLSSVSPVNDFSEFVVGETVTGITIDGKTIIEEHVYSIISDVEITQKGLYNQQGDSIDINSEIGVDGFVVIDKVEPGGIEGFEIIKPGLGYAVNEIILFNSPSGRGAKASILTVGANGEILTIRIIDEGYDYKEMPSYTIYTVAGSGAILYPVSSSIGKIKSVEINNFGVNYLSSETAGFPYTFPLQFSFDATKTSFFKNAFIYNDAWNDIFYKIGETVVGENSGARGIVRRLSPTTGMMAYSLSGTTDYTYTGNWNGTGWATVSRVHADDYDWTIWFRTPAVIPNHISLLGPQDANGVLTLRLGTTGLAILKSSGAVNLLSVTRFLPNTDYKIRVVGDQTSISLYVNDVLDNSGNLLETFVIGDQVIFGGNKTNQSWQGRIYRIQFRNTDEIVVNDWIFTSYENSNQKYIYDILDDDHAVLSAAYIATPFFTVLDNDFAVKPDLNSIPFIEGESFLGGTSGAIGYKIYKTFETIGSIVTGSISRYSGSYSNTDGWVSGNRYLQDSYYYQDFSYAISTIKDKDEWIGPLKDIIHPAGTVVFGYGLRGGVINSYSYGGWVYNLLLNDTEICKYDWKHHLINTNEWANYGNTQIRHYADYKIYDLAFIDVTLYEEEAPSGVIDDYTLNTIRRTEKSFGSKIRYTFPDLGQSLFIDGVNNLLIDTTNTLLL
jgi:hypothetical protein